jgi:glutaconyl-CoA/methylmalonyl-CoA decarboxylase subunit gamma
MKRYRIQVNGKSYDVEVEEVGESAPLKVAPSGPSAATPNPSSAPVQAVPAAAGDEVIASPMPGKIVSIRVKAGQAVKEGALLLVLEAMKMENEILCGRAGTVKEIRVTESALVNTGDILVIIG